MQKRLDFFEQILYDNQADLQIQPAQSKYDPLAQSVEHLTFNQGVRSSNLRWITKREVLKSLCINGFKAFFISISMRPIQSRVYCKPTGALLHFQIA